MVNNQGIRCYCMLDGTQRLCHSEKKTIDWNEMEENNDIETI